MKNTSYSIQDLLKFSIALFRSGIFLLFVFFLSCKKAETPVLSYIKGNALGTTYNIQFEYTKENREVDFKKEIESLIDTINKSMSTYIPNSDISKINKGDATIVIDHYFKEVFLKSEEIWKNTEGAFDPTVGSLVNAWGFGPGKKLNRISQTEIDSILEFVGFEKLSFTPQNTINKKHPNVFLDFNALAKGYTIDLIGDIFNRYGIQSYLIELGGEILAKGKNPKNGKNWVVAIDNPTQEDFSQEREFSAILKIKDKAMATSGNYRKFRIDPDTGERFVHTIDPKTGYTKKSSILSASVIAPTCMEADAYATAFMAMELDKTKALLKKLKKIEAYIMIAGKNDSIEIYVTEGFESLLTN